MPSTEPGPLSALDKGPLSELDSAALGHVSFGAGLKAPLKGVSFIARRPDLWLLAAAPAAAALIVAGALGTASITWLPRLGAALVGPTTTWYGDLGATAASVGITILGVLLSLIMGLTLAQPLAGPALEHLARAMEDSLGAPARPVVPIWRQMTRSAGAVLIGTSIGLPILAILTVVSLVFPVTAWVTVPLQVLVSGVMVTWDLMDYPFTVRGWTLARRVAWMRRNAPAVIGFGLSLGIVLLIPCISVLLLPAGAVGATWLYAHSQKPER